MRYLRNTKLVVGIGLIICGVALILTWWLHVPAREITRADLQTFLEANSLSEPVVTPSVYSGIDYAPQNHCGRRK